MAPEQGAPIPPDDALPEVEMAPLKARKPSRLRSVLPLLLGLGLVGFVLSRLDLNAFVDQLLRVNAPLFLAFAFAFVVALLVADTFATVFIYRRTVAPVAYRDFFIVRGASYLPSMLNHHVGQAFLTYFMARAYGVTLLRVAGATLLTYATWMGCVLGLASVALVLTGQAAAWLAIPLGAGVAYLIVIAWRPAALAETRLLAPLFDAGVSGHLIALAVRLPHMAVLFFGTWIPFWFFDVRIPVPTAVTYIPVLMVAVTIPITPQGVGTRDVLAAEFFEPFATGATHEQRLAAIAAATASFAVAILIAEAVLGLYFMRRAMPRMEAGALAKKSDS